MLTTEVVVTEDKITAKKPSVIKLPKVASVSDLFKGLVGIVAHSVTAMVSPNPSQWGNIAGSIAELITSFKIEDKIDAVAWNLLSKAMGKAMYGLVLENPHLFKVDNEQTLQDAIDNLLQEQEFTIDANFFDHPEKNSFFTQGQNILEAWLHAANTPDATIKNIVARLPSCFVNALRDEWRKDPDYYQELKEYFDSPFFKPVQYEQDWERYTAWLERQADDPVFGSTFSLRQIYVPLCAYYTKIDDKSGPASSSPKKMVVKLKEYLGTWLDTGNKDDAIRVLCGGPGCGKSTFAKLFAAGLAAKRKLLFIPLHRLVLKDDLEEAISAYFRREKHFNESPYEKEGILLIIFDGLDELTQRGKAHAEVVNQFIQQVETQVDVHNQTRLRLQVIVTSREITAQVNENFFPNEGQLLTILPYFVPEDNRDEYTDQHSLLLSDKRDEWWRKYGKVSGSGYEKLPRELRGESLDELTAQPLLNYLVALSFEGKTISFSSGTTRNELYDGLITSVYKKVYDPRHSR
jgi:hypothetical protein